MKTVFKNKTFLYLLISYISILLLWNIIIGIKNESFWAMLPITIEVVLLILIITRNEYARIAVIIWTIILLFGYSAGSLAYVLDVGNDLIDKTWGNMNVYDIIETLIQLGISILILDYTRRTVKVERFTGEESI